jgi:TusA-related sulfurtransferase
MTKLGVLLIAALVACNTKQPPAGDRTGAQAGAVVTRAGSGTGSAASADEAAGHNLTGLHPHQGANCPSSLAGTTTQIAMTPRGVDVTVTAKDTAVARQIVALARLHARGRTAEKSHPHDGKHGGSGAVGYCPVASTDQTTVTMTPLPDGATLHVEARSPGHVTDVQEMVRERAVRLPGYVSS